MFLTWVPTVCGDSASRRRSRRRSGPWRPVRGSRSRAATSDSVAAFGRPAWRPVPRRRRGPPRRPSAARLAPARRRPKRDSSRRAMEGLTGEPPASSIRTLLDDAGRHLVLQDVAGRAGLEAGEDALAVREHGHHGGFASRLHADAHRRIREMPSPSGRPRSTSSTSTGARTRKARAIGHVAEASRDPEIRLGPQQSRKASADLRVVLDQHDPGRPTSAPPRDFRVALPVTGDRCWALSVSMLPKSAARDRQIDARRSADRTRGQQCTGSVTVAQQGSRRRRPPGRDPSTTPKAVPGRPAGTESRSRRPPHAWRGCASGNAAVPGEMPAHGDDSVAMPSAKPSTAPRYRGCPRWQPGRPGCVRIAVIPIRVHGPCPLSWRYCQA